MRGRRSMFVGDGEGLVDHEISILKQHDPQRKIGSARFVGNHLVVTLDQPITDDQLFSAFGNAGVIITEQEFNGETRMISQFRIVEYSLE